MPRPPEGMPLRGSVRSKHRPTHRLSDLAYSQIKADIIRCLLAPGSDVTESQLAARYRLGKSPVRSALVRLAHDGLVRAFGRRGYRVVPVTLQDVHDIFQFRLILEPAVARLAAGRADAARLRELDAICEAGYVPGDRDSEAAFLRANREFHVTIARAAGNRRLSKTVGELLDEMERLLQLGLSLRNRTDEMRHEHRALCEALVRADADGAEQVTREQIETSRKMVIEALLDSPALVVASITTSAGETGPHDINGNADTGARGEPARRRGRLQSRGASA